MEERTDDCFVVVKQIDLSFSILVAFRWDIYPLVGSNYFVICIEKWTLRGITETTFELCFLQRISFDFARIHFIFTFTSLGRMI